MTGRFANIIVDISHEKVDRTFQYKIPDALQGKIEVGMAVTIPFGMGNKRIRGYVMELTDKAEYEIEKLKNIEAVIEGAVTAKSDAVRLAWWMKNNYGATMISALKTVLPVKQKMKQVVKRTLRCLVDADTAVMHAREFEAKHQTAKARLMRELGIQPVLPYTLVTGKLNIAPQTIQSLVKAGLVKVEAFDTYRNPMPAAVLQGWQNQGKKELSPNQRAIVEAVTGEYENGIRGTYLIHGVTGSGKTEVYMALIEHVIRMGKQAVMLIPEIALTYQTLLRFYQRFGERVSVMNSRLSAGERSDQCERARRGEIDIIIGPRFLRRLNGLGL